MGAHWQLAVILILAASLLFIPGCEEAEEDRVQEDVLVWSGQIQGEFAYVPFDEGSRELLLADADIWSIPLDVDD